MDTSFLQRIAHEAKEILLETIWPTRCAVCDIQGERVLCEDCERKLVRIDVELACPRCGAPYGRLQCTECNDVMLESAGMESFPLERMRHVFVLDEAARSIVSIYKDSNERRLASTMARLILPYIDPALVRENFVLTYIPDTKNAVRKRGFDHSEKMAYELSKVSGLHCERLLDRPMNIDQRGLSRRERVANMEKSMKVQECSRPLPPNILLIDDVCTTGSTVYSAANALKAAGAARIYALTFGLVND